MIISFLFRRYIFGLELLPFYLFLVVGGCLEILSLNKVRDLIIVAVVIGGGVGAGSETLGGSHGLDLSLELLDHLGAHLGDYAGEEGLEADSVGVTGDDVGVGGDGSLDLGVGEVDDLPVVAEEVDLLDPGDVSGAELLDGRGELAVGLAGGGAGGGLLFSADAAGDLLLGLAAEALRDHCLAGGENFLGLSHYVVFILEG